MNYEQMTDDEIQVAFREACKEVVECREPVQRTALSVDHGFAWFFTWGERPLLIPDISLLTGQQRYAKAFLQACAESKTAHVRVWRNLAGKPRVCAIYLTEDEHGEGISIAG